MSKKKKKNKVDISDHELSNLFLGGYGVLMRRINYYQLRLSKEDLKGVFFEWYHTTGSIVLCENSIYKGLQKIRDPEKVAVFINKFTKDKYEY